MSKNLYSSEIYLARDLLVRMFDEIPVITTQIYENEYSYGFDKYSAHIISWLLDKRMIVCYDTIRISESYTVNIHKLSELGKSIYYFTKLTEPSEVDNTTEIGMNILSILKKYDDYEIEPLLTLVTQEEQYAYERFYKSVNELNSISKYSNSDTEDFESSSDLITMFEMSVSIGEKDSNATRTNNYVFKKCMEELGEMALEDQIENGLNYKEPGSDGVAGEAVDLAICAMDMFALQHPGKTAEEIHNLFIEYMNKKIAKWKETIGM